VSLSTEGGAPASPIGNAGAGTNAGEGGKHSSRSWTLVRRMSRSREGARMSQCKCPLEGRITAGHAGRSGMSSAQAHIISDTCMKILYFYYHNLLLRMPKTFPKHARRLPDLPAPSPKRSRDSRGWACFPTRRPGGWACFGNESSIFRFLDIVVCVLFLALIPLHLVVCEIRTLKHARPTRMPARK
jgi:hypothetical protein